MRCRAASYQTVRSMRISRMALPPAVSAVRPVDDARPGGAEYDQSEDDAVPGEDREVVAGDVAQQPAYAQEGGNEGGDEADGPHADVVEGQQMALFVQLVRRGGKERRDSEEEREFGGGLSRQSEQQATDDGGARTRGAGDQRAGLCQTQFQGIERAHVVDAFDADLVHTLLRPQDDEGTDDEGHGDGHRLEQMRFDGFLEQQAEHGKRHEGDGKVEGQPVGQPVATEAGKYAGDACSVFPAHGEDRAGLDDDLEQLAAIVVEVEQVAGKDEVTGRGNRQEFGKALDDAEDQGFDEQKRVHAQRPFGRKGPDSITPACPRLTRNGASQAAGGAVSASRTPSQRRACSRESPHISSEGCSPPQQVGRAGLSHRPQRRSAVRLAQGTPAGLPCGCPGIGVAMEGATQQAAQLGRQWMMCLTGIEIG